MPACSLNKGAELAVGCARQVGELEVPPSTELELSGPRGKLELFWKHCGFGAIQISDGERQLWNPV